MRTLFLAVLVLTAAPAAAQPTFGIGVGSGADCQEVARQIMREWFDVKSAFTDEVGVRRPSTSEFRCVAPESVQGALPKRAISSSLRCFSMQGTGVCCDSQMMSCATL